MSLIVGGSIAVALVTRSLHAMGVNAICGLAMAESERYLPALISKIEPLLEQHGLADVRSTLRMTGCPNGCARPYIAEIAFTARALGKYNMYLGGGHHGQRLNRFYRENVGQVASWRNWTSCSPISRKNAGKASTSAISSFAPATCARCCTAEIRTMPENKNRVDLAVVRGFFAIELRYQAITLPIASAT